MATDREHSGSGGDCSERCFKNNMRTWIEKKADRERVMDEVSQLGKELLGGDAAGNGFPPKPPGVEGSDADEAGSADECEGRAGVKGGLATPVPTWEHRTGLR